VEAVAEIVFYVSPHGDDRWTGTLAEPDGAGNGPFATLTRAQTAVRALRSPDDVLPGPVRVLLRAGTYVLNDTLCFESADSGTATTPIVYAAFPGEAVCLSGGQRLGGWQTDTLPNGAACWRTCLPEDAPAAPSSRDWTLAQHLGHRQIHKREVDQKGSPPYSYTYSYTLISPSPEIQLLCLD
jgi:hypothetical protein